MDAGGSYPEQAQQPFVFTIHPSAATLRLDMPVKVTRCLTGAMTRRTSPADTRPLFSIETESVSHSAADFETDLRTFRWAGKPTVVGSAVATMEDGRAVEVPTFTNEVWTSRQRVANNLHEISYRACFKPQLPRFFIERLTRPCDPVYGPFMGRGTTLLEAAIDGRVPIGCDANPLSAVLLAPRLAPPTLAEVTERLDAIPLDRAGNVPKDLLVFYHPNTLGEICALRAYLLDRERAASLDGTVGDIRASRDVLHIAAGNIRSLLGPSTRACREERLPHAHSDTGHSRHGAIVRLGRHESTG